MKNICFLLTLLAFQGLVNAQTVSFDWAKKMGSTTNDYAYSVAVDSVGNVYTTGFFQGTVDFDPGAGTYNLTSAGLSDMFVTKLDSMGNFVWAKRVGGAASDYGFALTLDKQANVFIAGYFKGQADFDPSTAGTFNLTPVGSFDVFITKLDAAGNFVWAKQFGGASDELCYTIHVDAMGNIFTCGYFNSATDFDPSVNTNNLTPSGSFDIFISKLNANGDYVWAKQFGGSNYDIGRYITTDLNGNIYVSGYFNGTCDFDPSANTANLISAGLDDIFIAKLDSTGNYLWAKQFGGTSSDFMSSLVVDELGNTYTTGYFNTTAVFDSTTTTLVSNGQDDIFICKMDAAGNLVWVKQIGGASFDEAKSICMDSQHNLYITGSFNQTTDFDPNNGISTLTSAGGDDVFVCKLDTAGNFIWVKQIGGSSNDYAYSIKVNAENNIYTAGFFQGTCDFDPSVASSTMTSAGGPDAFIHKMSQQQMVSLKETIHQSFLLFPNPASNQLNMVFEKELLNAEIKITNTIGQIVFEKRHLNDNQFSLSIANFETGVYLVEVKENNILLRKLFVKN